MQKTITKNFLTHRSVVNTGEAPRYYVKNHHTGIIDRMTWDKVQAILTNRGRKFADKQGEEKKKKGAKKSPFANLFCGEIMDGKECGNSFARITYSKRAKNYSDDRGLAAQGDNSEGCREIYSFAYPVWRCRSKFRQNRKDSSKGSKECCCVKPCSSGLIHECAIEQSFMEMLYVLKRNWEEEKEKSLIVRLFETSYDEAGSRIKGNNVSQNRLDVLDMQIKELESQLQKGQKAESIEDKDAYYNGIYCNNAYRDNVYCKDVCCSDMDYNEDSGQMSDLRRNIMELKKERQKVQEEQDASSVLKHNFEFFLKCLQELPEVNGAGMKLKVNGLDVDGSCLRTADGKMKSGVRSEWKNGGTDIIQGLITQAPDYLHFEKGIYIAFIQRGVVLGDVIEYMTNFGVKLISKGNSRTLGSFLGFRKGKEDGTAELLTETWQVNGKKVQYRRKETGL